MAEPSPTAASTPSTPLTAAGAAAGGGGGAAGAGASPSLRWWLGESPLVLVVLYFCLNLGITIYNKAILKLFHFNFPWLLTAIHALLSCAGASLVLGNNSTYSARSATDASGKFSSDGTTYASPILPLVAPSSTSSSTPGAHQPSSSSSSSSSSSLPPPAHKSLFPHLRFRVSSLAVLPLRLLSRLIRALLVAFLHIASPTYSAAAASSTSSSSSTTTDHPHHPPHATAAAAPPREVLAILGFSVLYTVNIAVSNVSLNMVSLPFHQIVRSTSPAVTLLLERALYRLSSRGSRPPPPVEPATVGALGLVIAGVALATVGEYEFTAAGLAATLTGVVLSSLKGIATHRLLTTTNSTTTTGLASLTPLDLLWRMSALACIQCVLVSWASGELASYQAFLVRLASSPAGGGLTVPGLYAVLVLNGVMAFLLNYVSFAANRRVGALSMTVAGNVKQSMTILLSVWIFGYLISWVNGCGILVTLVGGAWYSAIGVRKKLKASARKEQDLGLSTTRKD
ncbi:triose-phosphate transporter family-domain-containing protein [Zopfochytrium polystomum]|nr:triose-phosphate transporter family-domain-containing protein [Zopfochytrium polystomum]